LIKQSDLAVKEALVTKNTRTSATTPTTNSKINKLRCADLLNTANGMVFVYLFTTWRNKTYIY
jgi:hypothetical protein